MDQILRVERYVCGAISTVSSPAKSRLLVRRWPQHGPKLIIISISALLQEQFYVEITNGKGGSMVDLELEPRTFPLTSPYVFCFRCWMFEQATDLLPVKQGARTFIWACCLSIVLVDE